MSYRAVIWQQITEQVTSDCYNGLLL